MNKEVFLVRSRSSVMHDISGLMVPVAALNQQIAGVQGRAVHLCMHWFPAVPISTARLHKFLRIVFAFGHS